MQILFVDTETTGVNFLEDQIIEIAGLIVELDPITLEFKEISKFESLVSLRQDMDAKITRITGITDLELATAPNLVTVQENWANWLEKFDSNLVIVGHSVDFDLKFLKKESWYLPDKTQIIDTLELTKIFLPQYSAINLEFLKEKLQLIPKIQADEMQSSHRALFDSRVCFLLFKSIIQILVTKNPNRKFLELLKTHFLPLDIDFYTHSKKVRVDKDQQVEIPKPETKIQIDFLGHKIEPSLQTKINHANPELALDLVIQLFELDLPREYILILLQIYIIYDIKLDFPGYNLKLHGQNKLAFCFAGLFFDLLEGLAEVDDFGENQSIVLSPFENIIGQIRNLVETTVDLSKILNYLEVYLSIKLHRQKLDLSTVLVEKWVGAYDFLLIALNPFWRSNEFRYFQYLLNYETKIITKKFGNLCELTGELRNIKLDSSDILLGLLTGKINKLAKSISISEKKDYTFRFFNNTLAISTQKESFDLQSHFTALFDRFPLLEIESYLPDLDFAKLLELLGVDYLFEQKQVSVNYLAQSLATYPDEGVVSQSLVELQDFFGEALEKAKSSQKSVIVLGGQNSTLKDAQKVIVENFKVEDYLILGESGSLTKIGSKLEKGFVGVVVTKVGDIYFLLRQKNIPQFEEVWIVNQPYLWVHPFWTAKAAASADSEDYLNGLKRIYLKFQINQISSLGQVRVRFLKGYKM
jgi:DNA polymerase III epsilon subunit-like protein